MAKPEKLYWVTIDDLILLRKALGFDISHYHHELPRNIEKAYARMNQFIADHRYERRVVLSSNTAQTLGINTNSFQPGPTQDELVLLHAIYRKPVPIL